MLLPHAEVKHAATNGNDASACVKGGYLVTVIWAIQYDRRVW